MGSVLFAGTDAELIYMSAVQPGNLCFYILAVNIAIGAGDLMASVCPAVVILIVVSACNGIPANVAGSVIGVSPFVETGISGNSQRSCFRGCQSKRSDHKYNDQELRGKFFECIKHIPLLTLIV